jgi:hypothetical protein
MRSLLILALATMSGCAAVIPVSVTSSPNSASLSLRDVDGKTFGESDGIWRVDAYRFKTPQAHIYISSGKHSVAYQCPRTTSWDDWASLQYEFEAGRSYEMVCEPKGDIVEAVVHLLPE